MEKIHTHYDNLKVTRDAPLEVIKAAYRVIAQKNHPDTNQAENSDQVMKIVNEAWRVLSDTNLRIEHDLWISNKEKAERETKIDSTIKSENIGAQHEQNGKGVLQNKFAFKIFDLKNTFDIRPLLVWIAILGGMIITGSIIESNRSHSVTNIVNLTDEPPIIFTPSSTNSINKSNSEGSVLSGLDLVSKPDVLSEPIQIVKQSALDSENKKLKFVPLKIPHGYIKGEKVDAADGLSRLTVDNSKGENDAEVRLYKDGIQVRAFNVQAGRSFIAKKLTNGIYKFRYRMYYGDRYHVFEANNAFEMIQKTTISEDQTITRFSDTQITLYKVLNGNLDLQEIDEGKF